MTPSIVAQVPWDAVMPALPQSALIALNSAIALLALWFLGAEVRRRRDWIPVYVLLGAGPAVFYEPLGDMLVSVLYPIRGQIGWIDTFGRQIPLFIGVLYFWYMSVPAVFFLRAVERGLNTRKLWLMYWAVFGFALGYELVGVNLGAWIYYGPQAFVLFGVPVWAPFTYTGFVVAQCVGVQLIVSTFRSDRHWLIVAAVPLLLAGGHCALALPAASAMWSTDNGIWIWSGAALTIALSIALVWAAGLIYCGDAHEAVVAPRRRQAAG